MATGIAALHVLFGSIALVAGPAALFARKGGAWHRRFGITFIGVMVIVLGTAAFMWQARGHLFLVPLGTVSAYLIFNGYRAIVRSRRRKASARQDGIDAAAAGFGIAAGAGAAYLGASAATPLMHSIAPALIGIGVIAIAFAVNELLGFAGPRLRLGWLAGHFASMIAAYISAITAFIVINAHGIPMMLRWLVPSALGGSMIVGYTLRYIYFPAPRRRRAKVPSPTSDGASAPVAAAPVPR